MEVSEAQRKYKLNKTVYVVDEDKIVSAVLRDVKQWTEHDARSRPDISIQIGHALLVVEIHPIAEMGRKRLGLPADIVFTTYRDANYAWQKQNGERVLLPPMLRSYPERLAYH